MTFGKVKSIIEKKLIDSYLNESHFKTTLKQFNKNILNNTNVSKIYSLYDQLSSPQGLNESDSKEYLNEGIEMIQKLLKVVKLPKTKVLIENKYEDIDTLVYNSKVELSEILESKKRILKVLMSETEEKKEIINLPVKTMVKIANQTVNNFINQLKESEKKELLSILSEDNKKLESKYTTLKEDTLEKLSELLDKEKENELKTKLSETIERIKNEEFNQINYFKLKTLSESI